MPALKTCTHCPIHRADGRCEQPCYHYDKLFEEYLVHGYARDVLREPLESNTAWRKRCQELVINARYLTHYLHSYIQLDRLKAAQTPTPDGPWPLWVQDRAVLAVKRYKRNKA
jgi:hypothetical protein